MSAKFRFIPQAFLRSILNTIGSLVVVVSWLSPVITGLVDGAASATDQEPVLWIWSGAVTQDSAVVKARLRLGAGKVRLLLSPNQTLEKARFELARDHQSPGRNNVVVFSLDHLKPNTQYHYSLEVDGVRSGQGRFHTFGDGPFSFRIALGSCASTGSNHKIFETIRLEEPLFFLHMGDFHYENIATNDPARFRTAYDRVLRSPRQGLLYRAAPIVYVWDDHDYGSDDSDRTSASRAAALQVYQEFVPHYQLQTENGALNSIHQAFTVGRIRFIVTDSRSNRDPEREPDGPSKSLLGVKQRVWLEQELEKAAPLWPVVVWVNPVPWITKNSRGSGHGWESYDFERRLLANKIRELGLEKRLVMLSGDAHMVAIDDGTNSNYATVGDPQEKAFPILHAAPLDRFPQIKGGPYSHGTRGSRFFLLNWIKTQQFGMFEVEDDGASIDITLSGHDKNGRLLEGMLLRIRCSGGVCQTSG